MPLAVAVTLGLALALAASGGPGTPGISGPTPGSPARNAASPAASPVPTPFPTTTAAATQSLPSPEPVKPSAVPKQSPTPADPSLIAPPATPAPPSPSQRTAIPEATAIPLATATGAPPTSTIQLKPIAVARPFPKLNFRRLTGLAQPNDGRDVLYVTEQKGFIKAFSNRQDAAKSSIFLDITGRVNEGGNEEGLLGLAFDPGYENNGFFYVYYSAKNPRRSVVSRFSVKPNDPGKADPGSESIVMEIGQPFSNHNGGQIAFGHDGYLYIALGDGGRGGDPMLNGQNTATLLGSLLRIDVSNLGGRFSYRIPGDNPFSSVAGAKPEIWAYGFRNPWRFSFDRETGDLWLGDVGQNLWEEINLVKKGRNYGWNVMEGTHCFRPRNGCNETGLELPIVEYSSSQGCSVIGGYVYRGTRLPSLFGAYLYGDFCRGTVWALRHDGQTVTEHILLAKLDAQITSFGEDQSGNVYILTRDDGIYQLVSREYP